MSDIINVSFVACWKIITLCKGWGRLQIGMLSRAASGSDLDVEQIELQKLIQIFGFITLATSWAPRASQHATQAKRRKAETISKDFQWHGIQFACSNICKPIQTHPNISNHIQTYPCTPRQLKRNPHSLLIIVYIVGNLFGVRCNS